MYFKLFSLIVTYMISILSAYKPSLVKCGSFSVSPNFCSSTTLTDSLDTVADDHFMKLALRHAQHAFREKEVNNFDILHIF